jgi:hypothetical protein
MRFFLIILLVIVQLPFAWTAQPSGDDERGSYSTLMDKGNIEFLRQLQKRLKAAGYEQVELIPQMFVAIVKRAGEEPTVIIVDYNTMRAMEVKGAIEFADEGKRSRPETYLRRD